MAYILTDDHLLTKGDKSLSYAELARLREAADAGDSAAAIRLAQMPAGEQRLAVMLTKAFGGEPGKVRKPKVAKNRKRAPVVPRDDPFSPAALLNSSYPDLREMARTALSGHG